MRVDLGSVSCDDAHHVCVACAVDIARLPSDYPGIYFSCYFVVCSLGGCVCVCVPVSFAEGSALFNGINTNDTCTAVR